MDTQHRNSKQLVKILLRCAFVAIGFGLILNGIRLSTGPLQATPNDLIVDAEVIDLGSVPQGIAAQFRCQVRNPSPDQITALTVVSSCGCMVIEQMANSLQPGETAVFTGVLSTIHQRGRTDVNLLIEYQIRQQKRRKVVTVTGDVQPVVTWQPSTLDFCSDAPQIVSFTAKNNADLAIERIHCKHPALKVVEVDVEGSEAAISVSVDYEQLNAVSWETHGPFIVSVKTNVDTEPELRVPVTVRQE